MSSCENTHHLLRSNDFKPSLCARGSRHTITYLLRKGVSGLSQAASVESAWLVRVKLLVLSDTHPRLPHAHPWFGHRPAGLGLDDLRPRAPRHALLLFGPLRLQRELIGHLKRLSQGQDDLIGQVLQKEGRKEGGNNKSQC